MVRWKACGLLLAAASGLAGAVSAQSIDWRRAGGGLFPGETSAEASTQDLELETARMAPLSQPYLDAIRAASERHGLDPKLLHALVLTESGYRAEVCSPAGACGLTQLMPGTARDLGVVDRFDPAENLRGGADYLTQQLVRFQDLRLALAAYNSGPHRVARLGRVPRIRETEDYVERVIGCYLALSAGRSIRSLADCAPRQAVS